LGGKTGTTDQAGACLILFTTNEHQGFYISIIMGAYSRDVLYYNMTNLLRQGVTVN
jgi:D-alanyl-D-alanine carboxypeptidase (penicillin-binding protein 5/6)